MLDSTVVFNEIMYHPVTDGDSMEWIEFHNQLAVDMDVSDWQLRGGVNFDFPDGTIVPGRGYLVVSSDPDALRAATGYDGALGPFVGRLGNDGDELKLYNNDQRLMNSVDYSDAGVWPVGPDGSGATLAKFKNNTASEDPSNWTTSLQIGGTPGQSNFFQDGSVNRTTLLASGAEAKAFVPTNGSLGLTWTEIGFDDSSWTTGTTGVGYERNSGYDSLFGLDLDDPPNNQPSISLHGNNQSAYVRIPFEISTDLSKFDSLQLRMKFDDGFVGFINGVEVARDNAPDNIAWDSGARGSRSDNLAVGFADYDITGFAGNLIQGQNMLAIQGLNQSLTSSDFLVLPEIVGVQEFEAQGPGVGSALVINEVQEADADEFWIELKNTGEDSIDLSGAVISATGQRGGEYVLVDRSIAAGDFLVVTEQELGFRPDEGERLFLFEAEKEQLIDARQVTNRLRGRAESLDGQWLFPTTPTPGTPNDFEINDDIVINEIMYHSFPQLSKPGTPSTFETTTILPIDWDLWRYNETGDNLGSDWYQIEYPVDNTEWFSGRGLIGYETSSLPEPLRTQITNPRDIDTITYYFQTDFNYDGEVEESSSVVLRHVIDDGAIFYLNGEEVGRFNMSGGNVTSSTQASAVVGNANYSSPIDVPAGLLRKGKNTLSAEVHQGSGNSSDIVFGVELEIRGELTPATPSVPFAESDEEWIELFNRGSEPVSLGGWELRDAVGFEFDEDATIDPGDYLIIAKDRRALANKFPDIDIAGSFSGSLSNQRDRVILVDQNGNPVDVVEYFERGEWPEYADGGGSSIELTDPFADNSKGGAWAASDEGLKSEWREYSATKVSGADLVGPNYNEFIFGLLDSGEFLIDDISLVESGGELIQNGTFENDSIGSSPDKWRLIGNHSGIVIPDAEQPGNNVLHMTAHGAQQHVHDHAETTFVGNTSIRSNREYTISFRAKWLAGNSQINNRLYFTRFGNTIVLDVPENRGTPGAPNSTLVQNAGPTFSNLNHSPVTPSSGQPVTVRVQVDDPQGVNSVRLFYSVNGGAFSSIPMTLQRDSYRATVPGQSSSRVVQFYVKATDAAGESSYYPADGPESRALYQVRGSGSTSLPIDTLQLVMLSRDEQTLFSDVNRMSNNYLGGTLVWNNEEVFYDIEARQVGSRFIRPNSGYKIRLNPEKLYNGVHESLRIDLNGLSEIVYKQMINRTGGSSVSMYDDIAFFVSPHSGHTRTVLLNLARYEGIYLSEQFENGTEGTKWELDDVTYPTDPNPAPEGLKTGTGVSSPDIQDRGDDPEAYRGHLLIKNNRAKDDFERIVELAQAINKSGNALYEATNEVMDVDLWMRHYATQAFLGNWDTYGFRRPKNLRIYHRPEDDKIIPLAWDFDLANLGEPLIYNGGATRLDEIRDIPQNLRLFWGHMWDLTNRGFNAEYIARWANHYSAVSGSNFGGEITDVRNRFSQARSEAQSAIPRVSFRITTNGGRDLSVNDNTVTLAGTGWIDVREIRWKESNVRLNVNWTSTDDWRTDLPLNLGDNLITLEAIDFEGNVISSDSITVTSSVGNSVVDSLRITEINYNPADPTNVELAIDPSLDNDDFEFVEVKNVGSNAINLLQSRFTNGIQFTFPAFDLDPGEFGVIVRNLDAFELRYGDQINVLGEFDGGLNNGGEGLTLVDADGTTVFDLDYRDDALWPQAADGIGATLVLNSPDTATPAQFSKHYQWRSSTEFGGSPGRVSATPMGVVINEVLTNTDPPVLASDSIELHNTTTAEIDVSGWFVSDAARSLFKYQIPDATIIPANGYLVLDASDFNPNPDNPGPNDFGLSGSRGDDVWITIQGDDGLPSHFVDDVHFIATASGESLARMPNGGGRLVPTAEPSIGSANTGAARVGPVIVSEFNYAPDGPTVQALAIDPEITADDLEFIEIHNPTTSVIDLTDWRIRGGVDYEFEADVKLPPNGLLVVVAFNPDRADNATRTAAFREQYGINASVRIVGGYSGRLNNSSERIQLQRPTLPPVDEPNFIPHVQEDEVVYDNLAPWPDGSGGSSLNRLPDIQLGIEALSWIASTPTPGTHGTPIDPDFNDDGVVDVHDVDLACSGVRVGLGVFDLNKDGTTDQQDILFLVQLLGSTSGDSNLDGVFNSSDLVQVFRIGVYEDTINGNANWSSGDWNCDGDFTTQDLVTAFQAGGYVSTAVAEVLPSGSMADWAMALRTHDDRLKVKRVT